MATRSFALLLLSIAFAAPSRGEEAPSAAASKARGAAGEQFTEKVSSARGIAAKQLSGSWSGEKDGTKVTLRFSGANSSWTVEQSRSPQGSERIEADQIEVAPTKVAQNKALQPVSVDLTKTFKATDERGNATGKEESFRLGVLHAGADDTLMLTIFPGRGYQAVEGLSLRLSPAAKPGDGRPELSEPQEITCGVLANLGFAQMAGDPDKPKAFPKFKVTKATLDFLKQYEGKTIEVSDDGSLEIEEH